MLKTSVAIGIAVAFVGFLISNNTANADTLTGCLNPGGQIISVAVGDTPARPCRANQTQVSLQVGNGNGGGGKSGVFEFEGFTTETIDGKPGGGVPTVYQICRDEFGPTARMCNRSEYFRSPALAYPAVTAWINTQVGADAPKDITEFVCAGFTTSSGNDSVLFSDGTISGRDNSCETKRPITCCARGN